MNFQRYLNVTLTLCTFTLHLIRKVVCLAASLGWLASGRINSRHVTTENMMCTISRLATVWPLSVLSQRFGQTMVGALCCL